MEEVGSIGRVSDHTHSATSLWERGRKGGKEGRKATKDREGEQALLLPSLIASCELAGWLAGFLWLWHICGIYTLLLLLLFQRYT